MGSEPKTALSDMLKGILSGTAEFGIASLPALGAFARYRNDMDWKMAALLGWAEADPKAHEILAHVITTTKEKIPKVFRDAIIAALQD